MFLAISLIIALMGAAIGLFKLFDWLTDDDGKYDGFRAIFYLFIAAETGYQLITGADVTETLGILVFSVSILEGLANIKSATTQFRQKKNGKSGQKEQTEE